jgi:hypothetical protein
MNADPERAKIAMMLVFPGAEDVSGDIHCAHADVPGELGHIVVHVNLDWTWSAYSTNARLNLLPWPGQYERPREALVELRDAYADFLAKRRECLENDERAFLIAIGG